jgi:hypothetical protein
MHRQTKRPATVRICLTAHHMACFPTGMETVPMIPMLSKTSRRHGQPGIPMRSQSSLKTRTGRSFHDGYGGVTGFGSLVEISRCCSASDVFFSVCNSKIPPKVQRLCLLFLLRSRLPSLELRNEHLTGTDMSKTPPKPLILLHT